MANPVVLGVAAFLAFMSVGIFRRALDVGRVLKSLRSLEPVPIASAAKGLQLVRGRIETDLPLMSPFQKRPCVYYLFRVQEPRAGKRPRNLATGKQWTDVKVRDDSGAASIDAVPAVVASPRRFETRLRGLTSIPPDLVDFFEQAGITETHLPRLSEMVVHEYTLEPGDEVYVTGTVEREGEEAVIRRVRRAPLVVSAERDIGLDRGYRNEFLLYAVLAPMVGAAGLVLGLMGFA